MKKGILCNKDGMVMLTVLGFITVLFIAGIAANQNVNNDISSVVKHMSNAQSLYIAEAGIARGKAECVVRHIAGSWTSFSPLLRGTDDTPGTSDDGVLSFGSSVSFHGGTYSVKVMNDTKDTGGAFTDTNNTLAIESIGTYRDSVTKLKVVIRMNKAPVVEGAATLLGEADTLFAGSSFLADGRDYRLSDGTTPTGPSPKYAITTFDGSSRTGVVDSLDSSQKDRVFGTGYDSSTSPATPSVGVSNSFTTEDLKSFVSVAKSLADNQLVNPSSLDGVNLGTTGSPKITYILKTDTTSIKVTGNTSGAGLLIIEGGNLEITITGNMSWIGMIMVVGRSVGFKQTGSGSLMGGLIVYEDNNPDVGKEMELGGNFEMKYSSEALALVNSMVSGKQKYTIVSWQKI